MLLFLVGPFSEIYTLRCFVTGCAGFIASNLANRLLSDGHTVVGYDNFSTGQQEFLTKALQNPSFSIVRADLLELDTLKSAMAGCEVVYHLAANADVRFGTDNPRRDLTRTRSQPITCSKPCAPTASNASRSPRRVPCTAKQL